MTCFAAQLLAAHNSQANLCVIYSAVICVVRRHMSGDTAGCMLTLMLWLISSGLNSVLCSCLLVAYAGALLVVARLHSCSTMQQCDQMHSVVQATLCVQAVN